MELTTNNIYYLSNTATTEEKKPYIFATARVEFDSPNTYFDYEEHGAQLEKEAKNLFETAMELKHGGTQKFDRNYGEFLSSLETGQPLITVNSFDINDNLHVYIPLHTYLITNDIRKMYKPAAHVSIARFIPNFPGSFSNALFSEDISPLLTPEYLAHRYKYAVEFPLAIDFSQQAMAHRRGDFTGEVD